jgi:hypothetical protein
MQISPMGEMMRAPRNRKSRIKREESEMAGDSGAAELEEPIDEPAEEPGEEPGSLEEFVNSLDLDELVELKTLIDAKIQETGK